MRLLRLLSLPLLFVFFSQFPSALAQEGVPTLFAPHALVVDVATGARLYEKASEEKVPVASLTKLMLALVALEENRLTEVVTISEKAALTVGSTAQLYIGERFYLKDLLYGLLIPSGNDAAVALAEHLAGIEANLVPKMNEKATELGMNNTHYGNVTGLFGDGGYSSARDLTLLAQRLLKEDLFRQIIQVKNTPLTSLAGVSRQIKTTNQLLGETVGGLKVLGMKTGTTEEAGECLMLLAQDEKGNELLLTVLGSTDRYQDARRLLTWVGENAKLGLPEPKPLLSLPAWPFADLRIDQPYFFQALVDLKAEGIVRGDDQTGLVRPQELLNRAEMLTFLLRAQGYDTDEAIKVCAESKGELMSSGFSDVSLNSWYAPSVRCAATLGWVSGDTLPVEALPGTLPTFRPADPVNLPEAMKLILLSQDHEAWPLEGENWYDVYVNPFLNGQIIEKEEALNQYFFSHADYSLGEITNDISRVAAFELLHRVNEAEIEGGGLLSYQPYLSLEAYRAQGATVEIRGDKLFVADPLLGFSISNLPMGQFNLSDLRFYIQNPSGFKSDYYTDWSIIYPTKNDTFTEKGEAIFHLLLPDPDYLATGFELTTNEKTEMQTASPFIFSCADTLRGDPDVTTLFLYLCPAGKMSEAITLETYLEISL